MSTQNVSFTEETWKAVDKSLYFCVEPSKSSTFCEYGMRIVYSNQDTFVILTFFEVCAHTPWFLGQSPGCNKIELVSKRESRKVRDCECGFAKTCRKVKRGSCLMGLLVMDVVGRENTYLSLVKTAMCYGMVGNVKPALMMIDVVARDKCFTE